MALMSVQCACWIRAMSSGQWKWWALFAVSEVAIIYAYPETILLLVLMNFFSVPLFFSRRESAQSVVAQSGRWFFVNSLAALAVTFLMLPLYPQTKLYMDQQRHVALGWPWIRNVISFFAAGVPWAKESTPDPTYPNLWHAATAHPLLFEAVTFGFFVLFVLGIVLFARKSTKLAAIVVMTFAVPVMVFIASRLNGVIIYEPYVNFVLPVVVGLVAVGAAAVAERLGNLSRAASVGFAAFVILVFAAGTWSSRIWLMSYPLEPIKESVIASRGTLDTRDEASRKILTGSFCIPPYLYDGRMVRLDSAKEFIDLMTRADAEGRPLVLNIGMPWAAKDYSPQMWKLFTDERLFEKPKQLRGFEPGLDRLVAKYKPGSVKTVDLSAIPPDQR